MKGSVEERNCRRRIECHPCRLADSDSYMSHYTCCIASAFHLHSFLPGLCGTGDVSRDAVTDSKSSNEMISKRNFGGQKRTPTDQLETETPFSSEASLIRSIILPYEDTRTGELVLWLMWLRDATWQLPRLFAMRNTFPNVRIMNGPTTPDKF